MLQRSCHRLVASGNHCSRLPVYTCKNCHLSLRPFIFANVIIEDQWLVGQDRDC